MSAVSITVPNGDPVGYRANLTTTLLVGAGPNLGLPMSTTHVAIGAITGLARKDLSRVNQRTLRDFGIPWTLTPFAVGLVSMVVFRLLS